METLREREAAIAMALNRRPKVQSDLADVIKTSFSPFFLGPIRPRASRLGGAKGAARERVKLLPGDHLG